MSQHDQNPGLFQKIIVSVAAAFALSITWGWRETELFWVPTLLLIALVAAPVALARNAIGGAIGMSKRAMAHIPSTAKGTARWATPSDLKKGRKHQSGPFWGLFEGKPLFLEFEAAALTVAPAGTGKTTTIVINNLCSIETSMIVADYKGELAACCAEARRKMGQKVYCLNPSGLFTDQAGAPARYNPLIILVDDWEHSQKDMLADARAMALQLVPEPPRTGENIFFRSASRKIITFASLVEVIEKGREATPSTVQSLVANPVAFREAVFRASVSDALDGDLAALALDFSEKFESGDPRQWGSFLEGALQALEVFSPSGRIAESVSWCDFRFSDLKAQNATVFVMSDATRHDVYAPWQGLILWAGITELMRAPAGNQVTLMLDEATNFRVEGLPSLLTKLRGYGVRTWIVIQELEDFARVYGREGLEILLSQTEIQLFFGSSSPQTLDLLSRRLGRETIKTQSHSLGGKLTDGIRTSLGEDGRNLFDPDEISTQSQAILFARSKPPALIEPVSYASIWPYCRRVAGNPYHKGRKLKERIRVWL
jgi:type IV secretion system protein VirD4